MRTRNGKRVQGFTLIELIIAVTIIGILAAIAIPSYTAYIQRANRSDARAMMLEAAAFMQRSFTQNSSYPTALPAAFRVSPSSGAARYNIGVLTSGATYTIAAVPAGTMAGDECRTLILDGVGQRGWATGATIASGGATAITGADFDPANVPARCWGR